MSTPPRPLSPPGLTFEGSPRLMLGLEAARLAGEELLRHFHGGAASASATIKSTSDGPQGLVTAADLAAESVILDLIRGSFPSDAILSEESAALTAEARGWRWIVDPLDGTNNFAHGIPHFAVSIAAELDGQTAWGIVLDPVQGDWFVAARGEGAWHNGEAARVSGHRQLEAAIVALGFYYDRGAMMRATLRTIEDLFGQGVRGVRRFGAAALDLAWTGIGRYGAYFEYTVAPWDRAAGALFVEEAGGRVTTCRGAAFPPGKSDILATNGWLHDAMLETTRRHWGPDARPRD